MSFLTAIDIANRACEHLGVTRIVAFTDVSRQATELNFCYDKLRRSELRRAVWNFATRRAVLRPVTSTANLLVPEAFDAVAAYGVGDIVTDSNGFWWLAVVASTGVTPGSEGANPHWIAYFGPQVIDAWSSTVQYFPGDLVYLTGVFYIAVAESLNHTPPNTTYWHVILDATLAAGIPLLSPLGYPPVPAAGSNRSRFILPVNFLRLAPQDPKIAGGERQLVTAGQHNNDYEIEGGSIYSAAQTGVFVLRFVADTQDVTGMNDLFCEALAARMAYETCETLTQSRDKFNDIAGAYNTAIQDARAVDAIEAGSTEPEQGAT